jgi:hypothetical protein
VTAFEPDAPAREALPSLARRAQKRPGLTEVSTDPSDVAAVRTAAGAEADVLYPQALEQVRAGGHLTPEQMHALRHRRARAARDLRAVADDVTASPAGRVAAAVALTDIGDAGGAERAAAFLADPSRELRIEALNRMNSGEGDVDWSVPGSVEALFRLIGDADEQVALTAAALASLAQVPGADAPVLARLDAGRVTDRAQWAGALSGVAHTPEAAARAARELFRNPPDRYWMRSLMYNLYWVRHHRDPAVRATARAAAREFCLRYLSNERTEVLVCDFAWVAESEDVPLLEQILATDRSLDSQLSALRALARLDPARAVDRALAHAPRGLPEHMVLRIFLAHATEADADRVIPLVRPSEHQLSAGDFDIFRGAWLLPGRRWCGSCCGSARPGGRSCGGGPTAYAATCGRGPSGACAESRSGRCSTPSPPPVPCLATPTR